MNIYNSFLIVLAGVCFTLSVQMGRLQAGSLLNTTINLRDYRQFLIQKHMITHLTVKHFRQS